MLVAGCRIEPYITDMPNRIPKPCRNTLCSQTTRNPSGYCDRHQPEALPCNWDKWQKKKGNTTQRGYGSRWQKLRKQVLRRDDYVCRVCLKAGRLTQATHVDHITPKSRGGGDSFSNLQSLCAACHARKTAGESQG